MGIQDVVVLRFSGSIKMEGELWFALCDQAPVVGSGMTEEDARSDLMNALYVYAESLAKRGELEGALKEGIIPSVSVSPTNVDITPSYLAANAPTTSWLITATRTPPDGVLALQPVVA